MELHSTVVRSSQGTGCESNLKPKSFRIPCSLVQANGEEEASSMKEPSAQLGYGSIPHSLWQRVAESGVAATEFPGKQAVESKSYPPASQDSR